MGSNNRYVPSLQSQINYLVEWFGEFSEMQRNDFLPILVQRFGNKGYVNGLLPEMESMGTLEETRPPSLFQCRIKLFMEWTETWGPEEQQMLLSQIKSIDQGFSEKYDQEVNEEVRHCSQEEDAANVE